MDLKRLRDETAAAHAATEETVPLMRSNLTRAEYATCLRRFYRLVHAWDTWADEHVPADLLPLMAGRRRADLLADDLRHLGEPLLPPAEPLQAQAEPLQAQAEPLQAQAEPPLCIERTVPGNPRSVFLGRMYVMEGSTLGGQYIAGHVEEHLGLSSGKGSSFFRGYGTATATRWQEFRTVLAALPDTETDTVVASAKNMFAIFQHAMRFDWEPNHPDTDMTHAPVAASNGLYAE